MTTVVNVKVSSIRPTYENLKEWCEDPKNVYIGRAGIVRIDGARYPPVESPWANPFKISEHMTRDVVLTKYRDHIEVKFGKTFRAELEKLRGKNLGCWCKPLACHGDILKDLLLEGKRCYIDSPTGPLGEVGKPRD